MRTLILEHWITLDGYAADENGGTGFFPATEENRQSDEDQLKLMDSIDTILLGRKTYEIFVDYWPDTEKEIISGKLNSIPKVVISNTLKRAPWGKWAEATIAAGDAIHQIQKLKQKQGRSIIVWGSITLSQALMKTGLVDEYRVQVCPVRLGKGKTLFPIQEHDDKLKLVSAKSFDTGVVCLTYQK